MGKIEDIAREGVSDWEVKEKVDELMTHFDEKFVPHEGRDNWYCGVTGQGETTDEYELDRVQQHHRTDFPKLDEFSVYRVEVSTPKVAVEVERIMGDVHGLDNGSKPNAPKDGDKIWVYIFRKE